MTPVVAVSGLRKVYRLGGDDVVALGGVDLTFNPGEFVADGPVGIRKIYLHADRRPVG